MFSVDNTKGMSQRGTTLEVSPESRIAEHATQEKQEANRTS